MDLREMGLEFVDSIHVAQDRNKWEVLVNMAITVRLNKVREFLIYLSDS
jgi:hypothetical protein